MEGKMCRENVCSTFTAKFVNVGNGSLHDVIIGQPV